MECPKTKWLKTTEVEEPKEIPQDIIEEVLDLFPKIKTGRAKTQDDKRKLITLYNTIYNTNYNTNTSCGSCLHSILRGIKTIYEKL